METLGMAVSVVCGLVCHRFNHTARHLFHTKWFIGSLTHQGKQFHNSQVVHSSLPNLGNLVDQGRKRILKLKTKDKVPKDYEMIYNAPMELTLRFAYPAFMTCSLALVGLLLYRHFNKENLVQPKNTGRDGKIKFLYPEAELWVFSSGLLLLVSAACSIVFKYPFRVYKHCNKKEYIGIYLSFVPSTLKQVRFKSASPTKFKNPFYFFLKDCHYVLDGNRKSFFMSHLFRVPKDLTDMFEQQRSIR